MVLVRKTTAKSKDGSAVSVVLTNAEHLLLTSLPEVLRDLLMDPNRSPKIIGRLFPRAFEDPREEEEHRRLIRESMLHERLELLDLFAGSLARTRAKLLRREVDLTLSEVDLWLHVINDYRLLLATLLDVRSNDWFKTPPKSEEEAVHYRLLVVLSHIEEELIAGVSAG